MLLSKRIRNIYNEYINEIKYMSTFRKRNDREETYCYGKRVGLKIAITQLIIDHCVDKYSIRVHDHEPIIHMIFGGK